MVTDLSPITITFGIVGHLVPLLEAYVRCHLADDDGTGGRRIRVQRKLRRGSRKSERRGPNQITYGNGAATHADLGEFHAFV